MLDHVGDPKFLHEVKEKGEYLKNGILALGKDSIHGVRGMGLMLGIIVDEGKHSAFANKLIENGVLAITAGKKCRFACCRRWSFPRRKWTKHWQSWQRYFKENAAQ